MEGTRLFRIEAMLRRVKGKKGKGRSRCTSIGQFLLFDIHRETELLMIGEMHLVGIG